MFTTPTKGERGNIVYKRTSHPFNTMENISFLIGFLSIHVTFHFYHKNNAFRNAHETRDCELSNCVKFYNLNASLWLRMSSNHLTVGERQKDLLSFPELPFMPKAPLSLSIPHIVRVFYSCLCLWFCYESTIFFWLNHKTSSSKCLILTRFIDSICLVLMKNIHPLRVV